MLLEHVICANLIKNSCPNKSFETLREFRFPDKFIHAFPYQERKSQIENKFYKRKLSRNQEFRFLSQGYREDQQNQGKEDHASARKNRSSKRDYSKGKKNGKLRNYANKIKEKAKEKPLKEEQYQPHQ